MSTMRSCCSSLAVYADCATAPISWVTALRRLRCPGASSFQPSAISSHGAVSIFSAAARPSSVSSKSFLLPSLSVAALGDLLDHLVAVHRPFGQQLEDCGADVAPLAATSSAPASATRTRTEAEA